MAKPARGAAKKPPHIPWFDDIPKKPRASRDSGAKPRRPDPIRVRGLAGALPKPNRTRPKLPKPAKAAGLQARPPLVDRSQIRVPRRLMISSPSKQPFRGLAARFAPR